jgi:hypothetical protein
VRGQEEILRERFAHERCATCGAFRRREDVITLAHRGSRWLMLVSCWHCQRRGIYIATFPQDELAPPPPQIHALDTNTLPFPALPSFPSLPSNPSLPSLPALPPDSGPITRGDVDAMRQFLMGFNGDFRTLFGGADS